MTEFETSDDIPFVLHGGEDENTAMYNRIAAINRINYLIRQKLPEFDLRTKSESYLKFLDLEIYRRHYQGKTKEKIDEAFCQKMADLCLEIESDEIKPEVNEKEFKTTVQVAMQFSQQELPPKPKRNFIQKMMDKIKK